MRSFYISVVVFISIFILSFSLHIYVDNTLDEIKTVSNEISIMEYDDLDESITNLYSIFHKNKNMLLITMDKEHIYDIEIKINVLYNMLRHNNYADIQVYSTEIVQLINTAKFSLISFF